MVSKLAAEEICATMIVTLRTWNLCYGPPLPLNVDSSGLELLPKTLIS